MPAIPSQMLPSAHSRLLPAFLSLFSLIAVMGCQTTAEDSVKSFVRVVQPNIEDQLAMTDSQMASRDLSNKAIFDIYKEARLLVEEHFAISLRNVTLQVVSNEELEKEVRYETAKLVLPQFSNPAFARRFLDQLMSDQQGTYAALYTGRKKSILVNQSLLASFLEPLVSEPGLARQALLALLIHEAIHAADDKMHDIHTRRELNFRASFSQSAAYEGHAQLVTRKLCAKASCLEGLQALDEFMFTAPESEDALEQSMQAISRNVLEYSYIEGERFLETLQKRKNGDDLVSSVLKSPPADPVQILDPENYPDNARINRNRVIFNIVSNLKHTWTKRPWALVETSPIKGLDMRDDPERRQATVEGFTRLIVSMVGGQFFDQSGSSIAPIEMTVMQTDTETTALLFAESFQQRAQNVIIANRKTDQASAQPNGVKFGSNKLSLTIGDQSSQAWPMEVFLSRIPISTQNSVNIDPSDKIYSTLIARSGAWVIQLGGQQYYQSSDMLELAETLMTDLRSNSIEFVGPLVSKR